MDLDCGDFRLFLVQGFVYAGNILVGHGLHIVQGPFELIFRQVSVFLELLQELVLVYVLFALLLDLSYDRIRR